MLGWAVGFFVIALIAALFGYGSVATAFAGIAQLLFWVFVALFAITLVIGLFTKRGPSTGIASGGRTAALLAVVVGVGVLLYAWVENDWSAEEAGRVLDENVAELGDNTGAVLGDAGERVGDVVQNTTDSVSDDASDAVDGDETTR